MIDRSTSQEVVGGGRSTRGVLDELGAWDAGSGPRTRLLARALGDAIDRGALAAGRRLPSERALAERLGVSRGLVVAAYDALLADGLVERRHGSGTYVHPGAGALPAEREGSALVGHLVERSGDDPTARTPIDLSLSVIHDLDDLAIPRLDGRALRAVEPETGYSPWGLHELRAAIARHVSGWGLPTDADQVIVTTGAQQAIAACAACWVRPGDTVVTDAPTYPGAISAFRQAGARLVGVPVDRGGIVLDPLERALRDRPALVYLQSGVHSPTGSILAANRRREIARLLARHRVPLVEDAALHDTAWSSAPPPIAASADATAPIAVIGSLSKLFWGGLRLGFVRAPNALAPRFARVKATLDLGSSAVSQVLAHRLLVRPDLDAFIARRRATSQRRADVLMAALGHAHPSWSWSSPKGGLSLWVRVGRDGDGAAVAREAAAHGVIVAPPAPLLPDAASERRWADHIRLSFSAPAPELLAAIARLV